MKQQKQPSKNIEESIRLLARKYADRLKAAIAERLEEMKADDKSHFLIYQVLGVSDQEGRLVDEYQNKGRLQTLETLYKGVNGQYYYGDAAWQYVKKRTGVDLLGILKKLAQENAQTS